MRRPTGSNLSISRAYSSKITGQTLPNCETLVTRDKDDSRTQTIGFKGVGDRVGFSHCVAKNRPALIVEDDAQMGPALHAPLLGDLE